MSAVTVGVPVICTAVGHKHIPELFHGNLAAKAEGTFIGALFVGMAGFGVWNAYEMTMHRAAPWYPDPNHPPTPSAIPGVPLP
jgi:hypothetical protein